ncbi:MAG: porin [Planctomycetes bacterium]|nr:porin [Planctomycetota bacterium]
MRTSSIAIALLSCALVAGSTHGQTLKHPQSIQPVSLNYDNYYYYHHAEGEETSPSDEAPQPEPEAKAAKSAGNSCCNGSNSCGTTCGDCRACGNCGCVRGCNCFLFGDGVPFSVFRNDNCLGLEIGFWSQVGYHTQGTNGFGDGLTNDYPNRVQLHQQWTYLERKANGDCGLDWGVRADLMYGTDGQDFQAFGGRPNDWDNSWDHGGAYGWALPQVYAELAFGDLSVKMGKFFRVLGYEQLPSPNNFFYSHAFSFYLSEPFTHSGVIADYALGDCVTVVGGWSLGFDTGFSRNGGDCFLGGLKLQLTDNLLFSYMTAIGDFGFEDRFNSDANGYAHTLLMTYNLGERWTFAVQSDLVDNDVLLGSTTNVLSVSEYVMYKLNDCWGVGGRFEWYKNPALGAGAAGEVSSMTAGLNWRPHANVVLRPEVRWDDYHSASLWRDSTLFGIDCIVTY